MPPTIPEPAPAPDRPGRMAALCVLLLFVATLVLNHRVMEFGFLNTRDDDLNLTVNPFMGGLTWARLHWMFTNTFYARRYIPLGWLQFSAVYEGAGLQPRAYHVLGLFLAAVDAVLVFAVVRAAQRRFAVAGRSEGGWAIGSAALAAGWWAYHPLRVENTAWVSGNLYGLALTFLLLSLWPYLASGTATGSRRLVLVGCAALAFTASLLTYPIALGVPILLALLDAVPAPGRAGPPLRRLLAEKLLFFAPLAAVLAVTIGARFAGAPLFGTVPGIGELPLLSRCAQACYIAVYYLWKPWWPFHLSPVYDTLVDFNPVGPVFIASMLAVLAITVAAIAVWHRQRLFTLLWVGYLAVMLPFFGFTEKPHWACDRYAVLPTLLVAVLLAAALGRLRTPSPRAIASVVLLALITGLGILSWGQQAIWRNDEVHLRYIVDHLAPGPTRELHRSRLLLLEFMRGDEAAASQAIAEGLVQHPTVAGYKHSAEIVLQKRSIEPYYGGACLLAIVQERTGLGFAQAGEHKEAEDHLDYALSFDDHFYQAAYNRALVLIDLNRPRDALDSYLSADRWGGADLKAEQRHRFLDLLQQLARERNDTQLAAAAGRAASR